MELEKFVLTYQMEGKTCRVETPVGGGGSGPGVRVHFDRRPTAGGIRLTVTLNAMTPVVLEQCRLEVLCNLEPTERVFCNGFQSWTHSRCFSPHEAMAGLRGIGRVLRLHRFGDAHFHDWPGRPGMFHSHTYTFVTRDGEQVFLAGSLDESSGYTLFGFDAGKDRLRIDKDCQGVEVAGRYRAFDLLLVFGPPSQVFERFFSLMETSCCPGPPRSGWTSWYLHYTRISEKVILENLANFSSRRIPLDIFQIDDGYQDAVGDWLRVKPTFPSGMAALAGAVHEAGYTAGLWLAPFVCETRSRLFRHHKDWLLRDARGRLVPAGWNPKWNGTFFALDIYHPGFRDYLRKVFASVLDNWGFDMVKLDFLYAAAMIHRKDKTRGKVMSDAMAFLRQCVGQRIILGCGVPLGAAFGQVEYCRIGADVAPVWEDRLLRWLRYPERISTYNSLVNTTCRYPMDGRAFGNDPDVFILRSHDQRMSRHQRHTLFLLNNLFGSLVFTSDDISRYNSKQTALLHSMFPVRAKKILKVTNDHVTVTVRFRIGELCYRVLANLTDEARPVDLKPGAYFCRKHGFVYVDGPVRLAAFASRCYLEISDRRPSVAGGSLHLFPGSEVQALDVSPEQIDIVRHPRACGSGTLWIRVPSAGRYTVNGETVETQEVLPGVHVAAAAFDAADEVH